MGQCAHSLQFSGFGFKFSERVGLFYECLFDDFKFEVEFFPAADRRQVELPKLSREAEGRPPFVEINNELQAQCTPEICQAHVRAYGFEFSGGVKRKWRARRNETSKRVAVEVIAMSWIGRPVRIRIVWRKYF